MYLSFSSFPEVREMKPKERLALQSKVSSSINLGSKYMWAMLFSLGTGVIFAGILADKGVKGDELGYATLGVMFFLWMVCYVYILNKKIHPEVKKLLRVNIPQNQLN